jgi:serine/threonine protein kinase
MALAIGTRIGPYEITAPLGEGGMGVVFRARDTRLQRDVALKLLPDHLAFDSDRLKRFQREAQLLASLNHPHIAHVYGLEPIASSAAGASTLQAIAMELVEGDTLGERIESRGPIPVDEAVTIAKQIVAALEAAHERGIVHRDLKPANIKLTPDGTVKVLDFGLAKEVGTSGSTAALSHSPTVTGQSMPGVIMGTLGYMSPEQARGKNVDARADIWAFGCVVYEMLTGRRAFDGETATDIIAKIVSGEPDWTRLPKTTPAGLSQLPRVALKKDPRERLQHIGDSRLFLSPGVLTSETQAPREHHPNRHWCWSPRSCRSRWACAALQRSGRRCDSRFRCPASRSCRTAWRSRPMGGRSRMSRPPTELRASGSGESTKQPPECCRVLRMPPACSGHPTTVTSASRRTGS